jgi:DNA adenine methylase
MKHVKAPVTWFGSKSRHLHWLLPLFPPHQVFVDVFGGSGSVLLGKKPSPVEVWNDRDERLVNLFRVLRDENLSAKLQQQLELTPYSRQEFQQCRDSEPSTDPVENARRFIVTCRQSHGGIGGNWSYSKGSTAMGISSAVRRYLAGVDRLPEIVSRLRHVQVENLDWRDVLARYDGPDTLFYMDPPYVLQTRVRGNYLCDFNDRDHQALIELLPAVSGKVMLSGYDSPLYTPLQTVGWNVVRESVVATTSRTRAERTECVWMNFRREAA